MALTLQQIHNLGDTVAGFVLAVFQADAPTFPLKLFGHRTLPSGAGPMPVNRLEIMASNFSRASDQMAFNSVGVPFYNHFRGTISFSVITQRADQKTVDNHAYAIGRVGYLMSRPAQKLVPAALGGLLVFDVVANGFSGSEDAPTDTDRSDGTFQFELGVPGSIYPAS